MKIIRKAKYSTFIEYYYENNVIKRIWADKEVWFYIRNNLYYSLHNNNGAAVNNCINCKNNDCYRKNSNNKYKRHFWLNHLQYFPKEFAEETNHKICLICNDFCKQECFI